MSIHSSLHGADSLVGERSVLSRLERIEQLQKEDRFDPESDSVFGLPKVRTKFRIKKKKLGDDEEGADQASEGTAGEEGVAEEAAE
jgi:small basic protein (TIGR04137 family)